MSRERFGLSAALALPLDAEGDVDYRRMVDHANWCLEAGCGSVTVFGTTGEGASLGRAERDAMLGALAGAGLDLRRRVLGGVSASALPDAVDQVRQVIGAGCRGVLLPPPFYFKGIGDDGLFEWFSRLFDAVGGAARDVLLYNIPSVTAVPLSVSLVGRLRHAYPEVVAGVKDSSGDFAYTQALLEAHGDLVVLIGDERCLADGVRLGAQGSISGLANICPADLVAIIDGGSHGPFVPALVEEVLRHPVVPAVKALIAHRTGDPAWRNTRPPLLPLDAPAASTLVEAFERLRATR